jgi:hypothetical protein
MVMFNAIERSENEGVMTSFMVVHRYAYEKLMKIMKIHIQSV